MKLYYDLHLHSCLSPCGDNDMTPYNLVHIFFVAKKLIPAQDYEWAVYGLQRRLLAAVFYPILFLIGLLVSDVYSTCDYFAA